MNRLQLAETIGADRKQLRRRLNDARSCLRPDLRKRMRQARFDFTKKQLIGDGLILEWRVRTNPKEPESYENQQTSVGAVVILSTQDCG